ncbi:MAG: M48 family metallopeptidase [Lachnospiraceae bacterium]
MSQAEKYNILNFNGILITVARRPIKNINIYIKPPFGEVLVTAPKYMSESRILSFIREKESWIREHQQRVKERAQNSGSLKTPEDRSVTQEQKEWLKERICFYARKWEPVMGVHCERWTIRDMTSRWGSCSVQKHTIRINLQLAKKPEKCLEYVIVHELTHLLEPSHNQRFHAYMKKFLPDYKEREKRLRGDI